MSYYNIFNWGFIIFNGVYGLISWFVMKPWCEYVLFETEETKNDILKQKVVQYLNHGCGALCLGISAMAYFLMQEDIPEKIKQNYILMQIVNWAYWTGFEIYFLCVGLNNPFIGIIQILLCILLFLLAIRVHYELKQPQNQNNVYI